MFDIDRTEVNRSVVGNTDIIGRTHGYIQFVAFNRLVGIDRQIAAVDGELIELGCRIRSLNNVSARKRHILSRNQRTVVRQRAFVEFESVAVFKRQIAVVDKISGQRFG